MKKRLITILLTLVMVLTMIPMTTGVANATIAPTQITTGAQLVTAFANGGSKVFELQNDITIDSKLAIEDKNANIIINGNGYKIIGADGAYDSNTTKHMISINSYDNKTITLTLNDVTLVSGTSFRGAIWIGKHDTSAQPRTTLNLNNVTIDSTKSAENGYAAITTDSGIINIFSNFKIIAGVNQYAGMDLTCTKGNTTLNFNSNVKASFVDNRTEEKKNTEPFIGVNEITTNGATINGVDYAGLVATTKDKPGCDIKVYPYTWEPYYETLALKIAAQAEIEAQKMLEDAKVIEKEEVITPILGGWNEVNGEVTEEAKAALDKALEGFTGAGYTPVKLMATQLVSGMNYKLLCAQTMITSEPVKTLKVVTVYQDLSGNASITNVEDYALTISTEETVAPNDKNSVKVSWNGQTLFEGFEAYRANKGSDEFVKMFDTTNDWYYNTLIANGKEYSYKVKGYVTVNGEKVYTEYSNVAAQIVK